MATKPTEKLTAIARATKLTSFTTNVPTAVVVSRYFATSKITWPSAFLRSQFTQRHYTIRRRESNRAEGHGLTIPPNVLARASGQSDQITVEPHGLTAVAPLHTLRRAEPSEAYPPSPRLRRVPTSHSSTGLHPWPSAKEGKRSPPEADQPQPEAGPP